jgi:hypothetical protein
MFSFRDIYKLADSIAFERATGNKANTKQTVYKISISKAPQQGCLFFAELYTDVSIRKFPFSTKRSIHNIVCHKGH